MYKREVETILDFFGDIGGLGEIVIGLGTLVTVSIVNRSMNSEMVKQVYNVQQYTNDLTSYTEAQKETKL